MKRRTSLFTLILVCLLALVTACGSSGGAASSPPKAPPTSPPEPTATSVPQATPTSAPELTPTSPPEPTPASAEAPAPASKPGEVQEVEVTSDAEGYHPDRISVKAGTLVRFTITNTDSDLHDLYNRKAKFEIEFPPMKIVEYEWVAPQEPGLIVVECTYHEGLFLKIDVVK